MEHAQTRVRLNEVVDKLEEALSEVKNLQEQLLQQKAQYEKMYVPSFHFSYSAQQLMVFRSSSVEWQNNGFPCFCHLA